MWFVSEAAPENWSLCVYKLLLNLVSGLLLPSHFEFINLLEGVIYIAKYI